MEQLLVKNLENLISLTSNNLKTLTLARSLLTNPNTSPSSLNSVAETLIQALDRRPQDPTCARHVIKVIGDAAAVHRYLAPSAIQSVRPFLNAGDHIAADALAVLDSLGEYSVLSEDVVISLASSSIVSARSRIADILVKNSTLLRPELMLRVFLGLSTDLYPLVRESAANGVTELLGRDEHWVDGAIVKCCYDRAVELLGDENELVRAAVVRWASECARLFAVTKVQNGNQLIDVIFIQLCWKARDMSLKVRIEAFTALGKVRMVSESVLVQSLSKRMLVSKNVESSLTECIVKESKCPLSSAAGAFVHGIEDEFHEVRTIACKSLGMLAKFSIQFAVDALNLLMELMNDDVVAVRLQTLQTLFEMAEHDHLKVQEKHMQMFLGVLADTSWVVRHTAREVLRLMKLPSPEMFKSSVDGLITNLVTHPEEEEDIFCVLFFIGKSHGNYTAKRVKEFEIEIASFREGELRLDSPQVAALLVLAVSLSFSNEWPKCAVVPAVFLYAIPLVGRISRSLKGVLHHDLLLVHLCNHSGMVLPGRTVKSKATELLPCLVGDISGNAKCTDPNETAEISSKGNLFELSGKSFCLEQCRQKGSNLDENTIQSMDFILKNVTQIWLLVQSERTHQAQRMLRACKEELEMIAWNADGSIAALLAFVLYYVRAIQIFAEIWEQLHPKHVIGMSVLDLLLDELDICLKQLRYSFLGYSREEEFHILELTLLGYVLRAYKVGMLSCHICNKMQSVFSRIEHLSEETLKQTEFYNEVRKSYLEHRMSEVTNPFPVDKLIQLFRIEQIPFSGGLKQIKADLLATGNGSENPLPFISGLPVGIPFKITVYNVSNKDMVWLQMAVGKSVQYVFLNLSQFEGSDPARTCTVNLPFYATPNAASFLLRACVCMECQIEGLVDCKRGRGGPRHDTMLISKEIDVYLIQIENR